VIYLIASLGVMFFYNGLIRFVIGPDDRIFTDGSRFIITAREPSFALQRSFGF